MQQHLISPMNDDFAEYLRDESRTVGSGESISFPRSEEEVIHIMKEIYPLDIPVTVQGARTGLAAGAVPHGGHVMNLSRMNRIQGMRQDGQGAFYVTVQPGMVLSQLRKSIELKAFDKTNWSADSIKAYGAFCDAPEQFFSPDPTEASATLGGMAACNASGARSYRYGSIRPYISALRMVLWNGHTLHLARGQATALGTDLVLVTEQGLEIKVSLPSYQMPGTKNASGYYVEQNMDAVDLFIGSDGTLGIITQLEIRLLPMPPVVWGITCFFREEMAAVGAVAAMKEELEEAASMEYFDGTALEILRRQKETGQAFAKLPEIPPKMGAAVYIELHCQKESHALEHLEKIGAAMEKNGARRSDTWVARVDVDRDRLLFFRHAVPESVNMLIDQRKKMHPSITKLGTDMAVPDQHLAHMVQVYRKTLAAHGLESAVWGHVGDNHLHVNILPQNPDEYETGKRIYEEWAAEVTRLGGAVSAEHGVGKLKARFLEVMYGREAVREMALLKRTFDPRGLLGAGNLFQPLKGGGNR